MYEFECGHTACINHCNKDITSVESIRYIAKETLESDNKYFDKDLAKKIIKLNDEELKSFIEDVGDENPDYDEFNGLLGFEDILYGYDVPKIICHICNMEVVSDSDLKRYLMRKYKVSEVEVFSEIKKENKRRKKLYDKEYFNYVIEHKQLESVEDLKKSLIEKYNSYEEFTQYITGIIEE